MMEAVRGDGRVPAPGVPDSILLLPTARVPGAILPEFSKHPSTTPVICSGMAHPRAPWFQIQNNWTHSSTPTDKIFSRQGQAKQGFCSNCGTDAGYSVPEPCFTEQKRQPASPWKFGPSNKNRTVIPLKSR